MILIYTWSVILLIQQLVYSFPTTSNNNQIGDFYNENYAKLVSELNVKCGVRNEISPLESRISNGEDSTNNEFPWQISLLTKTGKNGEYNYNGGGSIIHPSIVMTVAHRVYNLPADRIRIRAGQWNMLDDAELNQRQDRSVSKIIIHENFKLRKFINDIALLILAEPLILTSFISPVCLPTAYMNFDNDLCTASGWGKDKFGPDGKYQMILKKVDLSIVPHNQCECSYDNFMKGYKFTLDPSLVCAGGEADLDTCTGDGGSPLICPISKDSNQYYQVGIVAAGIGCGKSGLPGLYTNIPYVRSWIDEQVKKQGFDTTSYSQLEKNNYMLN